MCVRESACVFVLRVKERERWCVCVCVVNTTRERVDLATCLMFDCTNKLVDLIAAGSSLLRTLRELMWD